MTVNDEPNKGQRNTDGTFAKGNAGGPGRPAGSRNRATQAMQKVLEEEAEGITRKAAELALNGDTTAMRLCMERLYPPAKDKPVQLDLPTIEQPGDATRAMARITEAVANGEITPSEGQTVAATMETYRCTLETQELAQRLRDLETKLGVAE